MTWKNDTVIEIETITGRMAAFPAYHSGGDDLLIDLRGGSNLADPAWAQAAAESTPPGWVLKRGNTLFPVSVA